MEEIKFTKETIEAFLQEKMKSGNKPETIAEYRRILQKFQKELLPEEVLRENTLQQWKNTMQQEGKLAVRTINQTGGGEPVSAFHGRKKLAGILYAVERYGTDGFAAGRIYPAAASGKTTEKRAALFHHQIYLHFGAAYLGIAPNDSGFCKGRQRRFLRQ